jgi:hypothetical protein
MSAMIFRGPASGVARRCCRGTIGGRDWQRPDLQRKYGPYFSWYLQRKMAADAAAPR